MLAEIESTYGKYPSSNLIIAGDLYVDLDSSDHVSITVHNFFVRNIIVRCDRLFPNEGTATYINILLQQSSVIDYIALSSSCLVMDFAIIDRRTTFRITCRL
jgi:hypothetical protein